MDLNITQHDKLVQATRVWVAQTFYGPMFKQMRSSPFKSELFEGGRGGQAFQAQLDQHLAERMTNSRAADRIVNSIVRRIEGKQRERVSPSPGTPGEGRGEGSAISELRFEISNGIGPHPNPLPEYRARG